MRNGSCCRISPEGAAAFLLRVSLGVLFFFVGLDKFLAPIGAAGVSQKLAAGFHTTNLPAFLAVPFLHMLPYVEVTLGAVLVIGIFTQEALAASGLLLISLAFGKIFEQDYATVANNFNYVLLAAVGLYFASRDNLYSLDRLLRKK
jgi:thiosulfate dehydrogenase [quinone] large subunit